MSVSKDLMEILACPKCRNPVELDEEGQRIICKTCRVFYQIVDGIPVMLIEKAKPIDDF
ncbi:MAG: Trm112 family protein [Syntrophobacterales bacterium]|nr:Trm112 family protein [Syntrophobacterales bacterium]